MTERSDSEFSACYHKASLWNGIIPMPKLRMSRTYSRVECPESEDSYLNDSDVRVAQPCRVKPRHPALPGLGFPNLTDVL